MDSEEQIRCMHLKRVRDVRPRTPDRCEECLRYGSWWVHLRLCLTCGHLGCCDDSPNTHATKDFRKTQDLLIQSFEPGEDWGWCYVDDASVEAAPLQKARQ